MNSHEYKLKQLVDSLIAKTASGEITWEADENSVITKLQSATIVLAASRDESGQDAVRVFVHGKGANQSITFDDTEVIDWDENGRRLSYYTAMKNLLDNALRAARGEDQLINDVLSELGVDDDVPF